MKKLSVVFATFALVFCVSLLVAQSLSNKDKARALLESFQTGDTTTLAYISNEKYIQHNLNAPDGVGGLQTMLNKLKSLPANSVKLTVLRVFQDGDYVFTHSTDNLGAGGAEEVSFDVFRFEKGLVVEHWDNVGKKSPVKNASGHTQIDGPTTVTDLTQTAANKKIVQKYIDTILIKNKYDELATFLTPNYIEHNWQSRDGLENLRNNFALAKKNNFTVQYEKNFKVLGEGNFVLSMSHGKYGFDKGQDAAYYDLFRLENGKIAEHWDVVEVIPPKSDWKNQNGKF